MKTLIAALALLVLALPARADEYRIGTSQFLDYAASSTAATNALGEYTNRVRLVCTSACYVAIAASGQDAYAAVDTATSTYLPADVPEIFIAEGNATVAAIQVSSSGTLIITELSK